MLGPLAYLVSDFAASIKRSALAYGLMALGGLVLIFAAGYGLDAVHTLLMRRYGPAAASLIVAAALAVAAGGCVAIAFAMKGGTKRRKTARAAFFDRGPFLKPTTRSRIRALAAAAAGAGAAGLTVFGLVRSRRSGTEAKRKPRISPR